MKKTFKILLFIVLVCLFINIPIIANAQTIGEIENAANNNLSYFLSMPIQLITDGNRGGGASGSRAWYCFYEDQGGANRGNMKTAVLDIGKNSLNEVANQDGSRYVTLSTTNSEAARYAMQVAYSAVKSYIAHEPWGSGVGSAPYRLVMKDLVGLYAPTMRNEGLFNSELNYVVPPGGSLVNHLGSVGVAKKNEAEAYTEATKSFKFEDKSKKNTQTMVENDGYLFVGPYRVQKEGANSGELTSQITSMVATSQDGKNYNAYGWSTNTNASGVRNNIEIPNGSDFYVVFKDNRPESIKEIKVVRNVKGALRARIVFFGGDGGQDIGVYGGEFSTGGSRYEIVLPGVPFSSIKITKTDDESGAKLPDVGFIAYLENHGYLKATIPVSFTSDKKQATIYRTDANGVATIRNLNTKGTYKIYEVDNPNPGYMEATLDNIFNTTTVSVSIIGQTVNTSMTNRKVTHVSLVKKDQDSGKRLPDVGFIVYCQEKGYVIDGFPSSYTSDKTKATVYKTDANGEVTIRNLSERGTYTIYEVVNPHFGYIEVSLNNPEKKADITVSTLGQTQTNEIKNKRIYVKLSGYAWEDIISQKTSIKNNLWKNDANDSYDKRLNNITVTLRKADGTVLDSKKTNTITNTRGETEEGAYIFGDYQRDNSAKRIKIEDLKGAYIDFEYNGMCYQSVKVQTLIDNGNKATDATVRPNFNNQYATIVNGEARNENGNKTYNIDYSYSNHRSTVNYGGIYLYGYKGQKYPISGINSQYLLKANTKDAANDKLLGQRISIDDIYNQGLEEVPNINLGLAEREMPDVYIAQDIEKAKITLNGYEHTYQYDQRFQNPDAFDGDPFNIGVKFGNKYGTVPYYREIYSSDLVYNKQPGNEGKLSVYLTYKIGLKNEATTVYTKYNQVTNYYDQRYSIKSIVDQDGNRLNYTIDPNYNQAGYRRVRIDTNQNVGPQSVRYIYIEYQLDNNAVNAVLNGDVTLNSVTEVSSYSSYSNTGFNEKYAGIDKDSEPDTVVIGNTNTYEDDTDAAPSMILKASNTRTIKGTVWEDGAIQALLNKTGYDKERKGNGVYETTENILKNVKVELLSIQVGNNGETIYPVAKLYQYKRDGSVESTKDATMNTNEKGEYQFDGVIPGSYLLRFTYGNESVIYDANGNEVETIKVEKYKSTIYRNGNQTEAEASNDYWYRTETSKDNATRLSDAKDETGIKEDGTRFDVVERRTTTEELNNKIITEDRKIKEIESSTRKFDIKLDYDVNLDNISKYNADLKFIFDNMDFGIVRRPMQNLEVRKEISYVELVLANGQVIIKGDPRTEEINYLKFMPDGNVYIEIDNELIQGATLKVKYEIIVDNTKCEIDYNNKNYYYYGKVPNNHNGWKIATVTDLFDYKPDGLAFENTEVNAKWELLTEEQRRQLVNDGLITEEAYEVVKNYDQIIHTEEFKSMKPGEVKTVSMELAKLLPSDMKDLTFDNYIEVNKLDGRVPEDSTPGNLVPGDSTTHESDDDEVTIVITGPTGENKDYVQYIVLGTITLIILGTGIVFVKKKVLNKE